MAASSTKLALQECRRRGWDADLWQRFAGRVRYDGFGWIDLMAINPEGKIMVDSWDRNRIRPAAHFVAIQATIGDKAGHIRKYQQDPTTRRRILKWCDCYQHSAELWVFTRSKKGNVIRWKLKTFDLAMLLTK